MKVLAIGLLAGLFLLGLGAVSYVRMAKHHPAEWHVDPLDAPGTGQPNSYRVAPDGMASQSIDRTAPVYDASPEELARVFDAFALDQPRTTRIAGGPDELWATYVQRSRWIGFPDYISVRFVELPAGRASVAIYSRARFGKSDLGVNAERVGTWLDVLAPLETSAQ